MDIIVISNTVIKSQLKSTHKRIGINILSFVCLLLFSFSINAKEETISDMSDIKQTIEYFFNILDKKHKPTLKDYQWVRGESDYSEMQLFWKHCITGIKSAPLRDSACFNELTKGWTEKNNAPSYYLIWLQKQLPKVSKREIFKKTFIKVNSEIIGAQVEIKVDEKLVKLWVVNKESKKYGNVQIIDIDGIPLNILQQQESNASILIAMGLRKMIRPLTKEEKVQEKHESNENCKKLPACKERLEKRAELDAIFEIENKKIEKVTVKYKLWCKNNKTICDVEKAKELTSFRQKSKLKKYCAKNPSTCKTKVSAWYKHNKSLKNTFCNSHKKDCEIIQSIEQAQEKRKEERCLKSKSKCKGNKYLFYWALRSVKT